MLSNTIERTVDQPYDTTSRHVDEKPSRLRRIMRYGRAPFFFSRGTPHNRSSGAGHCNRQSTHNDTRGETCESAAASAISRNTARASVRNSNTSRATFFRGASRHPEHTHPRTLLGVRHRIDARNRAM